MTQRLRHPGAALATTFEGLTQDAVAATLGITRQTVNRLYGGRQAITPAMALRLEQVTGRSAEEWLMMQMKHELNKLRDEVAQGEGHAVVASKQSSRLKDLRDLAAGVPAAAIQARNAAFDGQRYRIKSRPFKG